MSWTFRAFALLALSAAPLAADAQVCGEDPVAEGLQYLRRLSLDLRGRFPDLAELESVVANQGQIDPGIIRGMVDSEDAIATLREHHLSLLWSNVTDLRLANQEWALAFGRRGGGAPDVYQLTSQGRMRRYRGGSVGCLDEPARFGANGEILTTPDPQDATIQREGYVLVRPYWDPSVEVKVCAFDAQTAETVTTRNRTIDCHLEGNDPRCGCGPELRWCQSIPDRTQDLITKAMGEQLLRFMDRVVREGRPYTEVITARDVEVNGPLSHYLRFQTQGILNQLFAIPDQDYPVPEIPFTEVDRWETVMREATHAGVLTLPGYLLKFQSNRGRANRFYNAFMCQTFVAPSTGLPAAEDECNREPNLTKRCGCMYCHLTVEPLAAFWGRWSEAGYSPMGEDVFPKVRPECGQAGGDRIAGCRRFYLTSPGHPDEEPYRGYLLSYVFATPDREANTAAGPRGLAQAAIDNGQFGACATKRLYERLLAREVAEADQPALAELGAAFASSGYDVRRLIEAIVTRPEYAEAGRFSGGAK